ncbi:MAG: PrsW family intramembrane metalloprotease [Phycisphaerae bacterium]|nr:PrsW family intramembrane metalloprotease [Phycisphaerae bacterium]
MSTPHEHDAEERDALRGAGSARAGWLVAVALALLGGPMASVAALVGSIKPGGWSPWMLIVFGPALEEVLKSCLAAWVVDRRARVFVARDQILLAGAWSGVCFAAVEAMMYTHRSLEAPSAELVWYRWTVCVVLHAACSLMAAIGLADSWESSRRGEKGGALAAAPFLLAAIVLHAGYNAMCVVLSIRGYAM